MNKISVVLADDHAVVRMGFRLLLQDTKDITVVGEAESGEEVLKLLNTLCGKRLIKKTLKIKKEVFMKYHMTKL